jgi:deferrochelatase/peroxidase EfeB
MTFTLPQFGIFAQGTHAHHFLEFDLRPEVTVADAVDAFRRLRTPDVSAGGVNLVVAFGADVWREVAPWAAPADLARFEPIAGADGHRVPATQRDAWLSDFSRPVGGAYYFAPSLDVLNELAGPERAL